MRKSPGQRIRDRRKSAGLSLRAVAGDAGISFSYLRDLEHGTRPLLPAMARRIAAACKAKTSA